jgi:hypothetical protein
MERDHRVKISHQLTILMFAGKATIMAQYAMLPDDVIVEVEGWLCENQSHRCAGFVEEWLDSYRDENPSRLHAERERKEREARREAEEAEFQRQMARIRGLWVEKIN